MRHVPLQTLAVLVSLVLPLHAQEEKEKAGDGDASGTEAALWLRSVAIAPDASQVAFSYRGDLWVVPSAGGGAARRLTTHVAHERWPVWSPDGKRLAFASDRHGNFDVFVMPAGGGRATRLTHWSGTDRPTAFSPDGERVLFSSTRQDAPWASIGSTWFSELYEVETGGGRPRQVLTTPALNARWSPDGKTIAYESFYGWENPWRKHHVSPVARDVWTWDAKTRRHEKRTDFPGEDREPVWAPDGKTLLYLSERSGSFNVWSRPAGGGGEPLQVTRHENHPVRSLSVADDGTLAYSFRGEIWTKKPGEEPRRLRVVAVADQRVNPTRFETFRDGATGFSVSPNEKELAFVVRGELFVTSMKHGTTVRVTSTPGQERSPSFAPDGRTIYFAAERDGSWNLYRVRPRRDEDELFSQSTAFLEEPVLVGPDESFHPKASPDGRRVAFLHHRDELRVLDLDTNETRTVVPAARLYSYSDGDIDFSWSPDGRWLAVGFLPHKSWSEDIAVVSSRGGELHNVTISGYYEFDPKWSPDGKALLFGSTRVGRRAHGSWGADEDVFALYLTREAYREAKRTQEEYELSQEQEDDDEAKDGDASGKKGKKGDEKVAPPEVKIEFEGLRERLKRLTRISAPMADFAMAPDGESLFTISRVDDEWGLWKFEPRKGEMHRLATLKGRGGGLRGDEKGEHVLVRAGNGTFRRIATKKGGESKPVPFAAEMTIDAPAERRYIFEHAWRQIKRKFYDPDLHGVDWDGLKREYARFLPHVADNHDFAELLAEMNGELNASHNGASYRPPRDEGDKTARLGLLFDPTHEGNGLKVVEVLRDGPLDRPDAQVAYGALLTHVDGSELTPAVNHHALLNRKEGKRVLLTFRGADQKTFTELVKPVSWRAETRLVYERWVRQRREKVEELSGGRLGYVHVRSMNDKSFRHVFQEALGRYVAAEALVVDTRFNGGGWLHDDLVKFLGGKRYAIFHPRGKERGSLGAEPFQRWHKPSVVIVSEANYSDAHVFPYAYQYLGLGKLVGTPVAGTGTAVWWERQIDPTIVFGIPQVGLVNPKTNRYIENDTLKPDLEIDNDANARQKGEDPQLEAAVKHLVEKLAE